MAEHCPACGYRLAPNAVLAWGGYTLDEASNRLTLNAGEIFRLKPMTTVITACLIRAKGRLVTKESLYSAMYGLRPECDQPEIKIVDVQISELRKTVPVLRPYLRTVWGRGLELRPFN